MMIKMRQKNGQTILEYSILIVVVLASLLTMQMYMKRGMQGRIKSTIDDMGEQFSPGNTEVVTHRKSSSVSTEASDAGASTSTLTSETSSETMNSSIIDTEYEYWGKTPE